jgi:hypothetical protein
MASEKFDLNEAPIDMSDIDVVAATKRRRGGQPRNLNGAKNPWNVFWRRRAVKERDKWIIPLIEGYAAELLADRGGIEGATAAERHVIEVAQTARGAAMLILKECSERGMVVVTDAGWDLAPGMKELSRFLTLELNALRTIGMAKREPKQLYDLRDYIRKKYGNHDADEKADENAQDAQGDAQAAQDDQEAE